MDPKRESALTRCAPVEGVAYISVLRSLIVYFIASVLTLPFLDTLWLGEVPLLALVQLPKTALASWLRTDVVMEAMRTLGVSQGSFSPDYIVARSYALTITYVIPLGILFATQWVRTRMGLPYRRWSCILLLVAALDFCFIVVFAGGPGFTIY